MFKISGQIRKANRSANKTPEPTSVIVTTLPNYGEIEDEIQAPLPGVVSNGSISKLGASNSDWMQHIMLRPLDTDFLQPLYLTEKAEKSIKSAVKSIYRPLKPWQTRLLVLHAAKPESPLSSALVEVDVIDGNGMGISESSEIVKFEALSYAWGDPTPVCSIVCNGTTFPIALELATALQYLRSRTVNRYIWCDAICINQQDLAEKSHQVKNMLRIFEKADVVLAWLGKPCSSSGRLFDALELISNTSNSLNTYAHDCKALSAIEDLIQALGSHLGSPWFFRTWVRQEVFAARNIIVNFGPYQLDFETFFNKVHCLRGLVSAQGLECSQITMPSTLQVYQSDYQHRGTDLHNFERKTTLTSYTEHWVKVLRSGALFKVSDERDRVYGAIGLVTSISLKFFTRLPAAPDSVTSFPIDYNKSLSEVYQDVTKFLINTSKHLEILDIFRDRRNLESSSLSSWATDWSRETEEYGLFHTE